MRSQGRKRYTRGYDSEDKRYYPGADFAWTWGESWPSGSGVFAPVASIVGLTINPTYGETAEIGTHGSITALTSEGIITAVKWGSSADGAQYGTDTNPTDFSANDGGTLHLTITVDGEDYATSATIRQPEPTFSVQPTIGGDTVVGGIVTLTEGTAGPAATLGITIFTLGGVDKSGELSGLDWDTTGESGGTIALQVTATSTWGAVASNLVVGTLSAVPANAIQQRDGSYITQRDGKFIEVR